MAESAPRQLFVNLAVRDLQKSIEFFTKLGFEFNPQFTDEKATCMIVGSDAFVMLLTEPFFKGFADKELCDTSTHTEGIFAVSCPSREAVDTMVNQAIVGGGQHAKESRDLGWMYGWSFCDLDGHHWETFWMDPAGPG